MQTYWRRVYQEWCWFIDQVVVFCNKNSIELVIIDSLTAFWPVKDENDASDVIAALQPLNSLLEQSIAVLLLHHIRKGDGAEATASRGSGALPSYVDIIVELRRFDNKNPEDRQRVLMCYSRFDETPVDIVIELTDNGYEVRGSRQQVTQRVKLRILLDLLPLEPEGLTISQILANWQNIKPDRTTVYRWLKKLGVQGEVKVVGKSTEKGEPELWARTIALQDPANGDAQEQRTEKTKNEEQTRQEVEPEPLTIDSSLIASDQTQLAIQNPLLSS